ncbi:MAG: polysaccharide biosynthesis/export family protein [Henriciella sp.]|nr:polysaccharide biosynthesis/export family protein [Henriciella sp.]
MKTRVIKSICVAAALSLAGALGACETAPVASTPVERTIESAAAVQRSVGEYRLGTSDELRITVFGEEELSGEYVVDGAGRVALPLIGQIEALDLTADEFARRAEQRYAAGYLREPRINVEVLNYRPFYILGEVETPGEYPYTNGLTVMNAIATAGGFTYRANKRVVAIRSAEDADEERIALEPSTQVLPGDTIRVIEKFF